MFSNVEAENDAFSRRPTYLAKHCSLGDIFLLSAVGEWWKCSVGAHQLGHSQRSQKAHPRYQQDRTTW